LSESKVRKETIKAPNHIWEICENFAMTGFNDSAGSKLCITMARNVAEPSGDSSPNLVRYQFASITMTPATARKMGKALLDGASAMETVTSAEDDREITGSKGEVE
jgi:hypothetical protein